jgi:hypothetical protein
MDAVSSKGVDIDTHDSYTPPELVMSPQQLSGRTTAIAVAEQGEPALTNFTWSVLMDRPVPVKVKGEDATFSPL